MLLDPTAQQIGIGGMVAVLMTAAVLKFLPSFMRALREQNHKDREHDKGGRGDKVGDLTALEWEGRIRDIARNAHAVSTEELMKDIRGLLEARDAARNTTLREIIRQELSNLRR